jgi:glycosyltransferase involved in cell wall biosynthesis
MRILQLIYEAPGSPFGFGGAGVRAYEIYRRLSGRHDITLLSMRFPGARDREQDGFRVVYVGTESESLVKSVLAYTLKAAAYIRRYGRTFDIIVENFLPSTPFFTRFLTRRPVILQVQGIMERRVTRNINPGGIGTLSPKKNSPLYSVPMALVESFYPGLYDTFLFVSEVTEKKVLARVSRPVHFSSVIPNGINDDLLKTDPQDGSSLLFFSRLDVYQKGIDVLIAAFAKISERYQDITLVLAGYEFDKFERIVTGLAPALRERIVYAGFVTGEKKARLLSQARLFVLPSRYESLPISIFEAAACGKAVLVSDIAEMAFVEREGFGLSFASGSVEGLAEKMDLLMQDKDLRARLGRRGREFARDYLWDTIALRFEEVLTDIAVRKRR